MPSSLGSPRSRIDEVGDEGARVVERGSPSLGGASRRSPRAAASACRTWAISASSSTTSTRGGSVRALRAILKTLPEAGFKARAANGKPPMPRASLEGPSPRPHRRPARKPRARRGAPRCRASRGCASSRTSSTSSGLGLVALGVFLAFVLWTGTRGRPARRRSRTGLRWLDRRRRLRGAGRARAARRARARARPCCPPCARCAPASICLDRSACCSPWPPARSASAPATRARAIWTRDAFEVRGGAVGRGHVLGRLTPRLARSARTSSPSSADDRRACSSSAARPSPASSATRHAGVADTSRALRERGSTAAPALGLDPDRPAALYPPEPVGEERRRPAPPPWDDDPEPEDGLASPRPLWPEEAADEEPEAVEPESSPSRRPTLPRRARGRAGPS